MEDDEAAFEPPFRWNNSGMQMGKAEGIKNKCPSRGGLCACSGACLFPDYNKPYNHPLNEEQPIFIPQMSICHDWKKTNAINGYPTFYQVDLAGFPSLSIKFPSINNVVSIIAYNASSYRTSKTVTIQLPNDEMFDNSRPVELSKGILTFFVKNTEISNVFENIQIVDK